jgi:preprotein translocase subunit SecF
MNYKINTKMEETQTQEKPKGNWHDRHYKTLLIIPITLLLFSLIYLGIFYSNHNDIFHKDISLTGGTSVTLYGDFDEVKLVSDLQEKLPNLNVREIYDLTTRKQIALILETTLEGESTKNILQDYLGYDLTGENSSFEFTGSSLSQSFYKQLLLAILVSFIFMAIVVFIIFKEWVPSFAVIISAFADIMMTLVVADLIGMKISTAGIVAFLMLIGYSVDTDILLTTRALKRHEGSLNKRIWESFKTGITMTLTSIVAVAVALFFAASFSSTLSQIFTILIIGLCFDIFNTWITNVSIVKWYVVSKHPGEVQ